ncbi:hypothetical protein FHR72_003914 [Mycolicibacterium iranicum]|uniref:Uncharacterized protein n=1 Tax=Mycolicibacterium iranicum TaxID=912594 RepID=A0A839QD42_MYCIR|nr:hypothetical protein [Mycolicibacterium iranicum]
MYSEFVKKLIRIVTEAQVSKSRGANAFRNAGYAE